MATFLRIGKRIINAEHVTKVERLELKPPQVEITLTSIEDVGNGETYTSPQSQTFTVSGEAAERVWAWFEQRADNSADVAPSGNGHAAISVQEELDRR